MLETTKGTYAGAMIMTTRTLFSFLHSKACITMAFNNHEFLSQALGSSISPNAMAFGSVEGFSRMTFHFLHMKQ